MKSTNERDVMIIGSGPAGLAAAIKAKEAGAENVVIIERDEKPGGLLHQCVHNGFGLSYFGQDLSGPEYAHRFIEKVQDFPKEHDLRLDKQVLLDSAAFKNRISWCFLSRDKSRKRGNGYIQEWEGPGKVFGVCRKGGGAI